MPARTLATALLLCCTALAAAAQSGDDKDLREAAKKAKSYRDQGKIREAAKECERALRLAEKAYGADDLRTAPHVSNLAAMHLEQNRYKDAEPLFRRALQIREDN